MPLAQFAFAPADTIVELSEDKVRKLLSCPEDERVGHWSDDVARTLDTRPYGVVFRIGRLRRGEEESRTIALAIAQVITAALKRRGAPDLLRVERDGLQNSYVIPGCQFRTLLPHHDSSHVTYLTPSQVNVPNFDAAMRQFSSRGVTTTQTHKMYHGFLLVNPGSALSVTSFYDKVALLRRACERATQRPVGLTDVASWAGMNVRRAWLLREKSGCRYLTLGGALGASGDAALGAAIHWSEADFDGDQIARYPELTRYRVADSRSQLSPVERFFESILQETLGLSLQEFRRQYELCVCGERYDYILGHNLTNIHGGLLGGRDRQVEPICLVVDTPAGEQYERWLARGWQNHWQEE